MTAATVITAVVAAPLAATAAPTEPSSLAVADTAPAALTVAEPQDPPRELVRATRHRRTVDGSPDSTAAVAVVQAPPVVRPPAPPVVRKPQPPAPPTRPRAPRTRPPVPPAAPPVVASGSVAAVLAYAMAQRGKPYVFGAAGPGAFDCTGLIMMAYRQIGVSLPHQTGALAGRGRPVTRAQLQPGDVVFPSSGHAGIYVGGGNMIHAPRSGTVVKVAPVYNFAFARRIVG